MPLDREQRTEDQLDVRRLVRWLGPQGARAGLQQSKICTVALLQQIAQELGIEAKGANRAHLIDDIVRVANKRIDKTLKDLLLLPEQELADYFRRVGATRDELIDLLKELDISPRNEGIGGLVDFTAREVSETARYMRIAGTADAHREGKGGDVSMTGDVSAGGGREGEGGDATIRGGQGRHRGGDVNLGPGKYRAGDGGRGRGGDLNISGGDAADK